MAGLVLLLRFTNEYISVIEYSIGPHSVGSVSCTAFESVPRANVYVDAAAAMV